MNIERIKALAGCFGVQGYGIQLRDEWVNFACPFAPWTHKGGSDLNPSSGVRINNTGESVFKCWSCGKSMSVSDMVLELLYLTRYKPKQVIFNLKYAMDLISMEGEEGVIHNYQPVDYEEVKSKKEVVFPKEWLKTFFKKYDHPYLSERGIPPDIAEMFDLRIDIMDKRICTPLYSFTGQLLGLQGRSYVNSGLRYKLYDYQGKYNPHVWGNEINCNLDDALILTEGSFDAMKIATVYQNVLFSLTSSLSERKLKRILDADKVITFYDYGTGGDTARAKIEKFFENTDSVVFDIIPEKDLGDAGAMSSKEIQTQLNKYIKC